MMMIGGGNMINKIKKRNVYVCVCNWDMNNKMR